MPKKNPKAKNGRKLTAKKLEGVKPLTVRDVASGVAVGQRSHKPFNP